jgi:hypothetical protein
MGDRTPDLLNAIQALYQLSYRPMGDHGCIQTSVQREPRRIRWGMSVCQEYFLDKGLDSGPPARILHRAHLELGEIISNHSDGRSRDLRYYI